MAILNVEASLSPEGRLTLKGEELDEHLAQASWVELWHSQPDRGLAVRFLSQETKSSLVLNRPEGDSPVWTIDAAEFLNKVGFGLPSVEIKPKVGAFNEERSVLAMKLEAD